MCPPMILWLGEAAGVAEKTVAAAITAYRKAQPELPSQCAAIRKIVPWAIVEAQLLKKKVSVKKYNVSIRQAENMLNGYDGDGYWDFSKHLK